MGRKCGIDPRSALWIRFWCSRFKTPLVAARERRNTSLVNWGALPGLARMSGPAESLHGAAQLVAGEVRIALRRVQVLVPKQLLDLAQVRARP